MRPPVESSACQAMDEEIGPLESQRHVEQQGNVKVIFDDLRPPEDRQPITIRIICRDNESPRSEEPKSPLVRVIHADELKQMLEADHKFENREEEMLTFGESITLLIAIGVLIYLIYALLWPERF